MTDSERRDFLSAEIKKMSQKQKAITYLISLTTHVNTLRTILNNAEDELESSWEGYKDLLEEPNAQGN